MLLNDESASLVGETINGVERSVQRGRRRLSTALFLISFFLTNLFCHLQQMLTFVACREPSLPQAR